MHIGNVDRMSLKEADFYGSTSQIMKDIAARVEDNQLERAFVALRM